MKFKAYHKIRQFKDVVRDIRHLANYTGMTDINGDPIYEKKGKPTVTFKGTIKLHGTNAGVAYTPEEGIIAQKRSSLLPHGDYLKGNSHFGFNEFVHLENKKYFHDMLHEFWLAFAGEEEQIHVFGEWAGKGVQKGVAISETEKQFYIFDVLCYNPITEEENWIDIEGEIFLHPRVHNIHKFLTYSIDIDFNSPELSQNKMVDITNVVEKLCPVANVWGYEGVGEGVVWTAIVDGTKHIFKVKGAKHAVNSRVKQLAPVDEIVVKSIADFVDYACTPNRIDQGIREVEAREKRDIPHLLRWVSNDIIAEEHEAMKANNLEWKQVAREFSNRVRQYYFQKLDMG